MAEHETAFAAELARRNSDPSGRRWWFVPYDQLGTQHGALAEEDPEELGIVLVECPAKARRRPYHRQKLALVLANLRQFALEQAARGVAVVHTVAPGEDGTYGDALRVQAKELGPLRCAEPAERELRRELAPLVDDELLELTPNDRWLTTVEQFRESQGDSPPWRMDSFYRRVRRDTGILMDEDGKPVGGKWSFDAENREPWKGEPEAAVPPTFTPDEITNEVATLIEERFGDHPGKLDPTALPTTADDAQTLWSWAKRDCLPRFGPYEDAMSTESRNLFHTRVSSLVNLGRLSPHALLEDACALDLPLASLEGFVRQILGWREFVRHVHAETDGLRSFPGDFEVPGASKGRPSMLGADRPLPPAFWGEASGLACLDEVVESVWDEGYSHHITRLMILSNLATLLDVSPRELSDWFWVAYTDAYDWVVEPNVLAMGTFALGELMTTKPYVSGAAYIDRMSDYCSSCAFHPKKTCPITPLYWSFLARHEEELSSNPRLRMPYASLRRRDDEKKAEDAETFEHVAETLAKGERLEPR